MDQRAGDRAWSPGYAAATPMSSGRNSCSTGSPSAVATSAAREGVTRQRPLMTRPRWCRSRPVQAARARIVIRCSAKYDLMGCGCSKSIATPESRGRRDHGPPERGALTGWVCGRSSGDGSFTLREPTHVLRRIYAALQGELVVTYVVTNGHARSSRDLGRQIVQPCFGSGQRSPATQHHPIQSRAKRDGQSVRVEPWPTRRCGAHNHGFGNGAQQRTSAINRGLVPGPCERGTIV